MNQQERDEYLALGWVGEGWRPLVTELDQKLSAIDPDYTIEQVKEKFGGLRYYLSSSSGRAEELYATAREYEDKSFWICENCGSDVEVSTGPGSRTYWVKTLCATCAGR